MTTVFESTFETGTLADQGWAQAGSGTAILSPGNGFGGSQAVRVATVNEAIHRYFLQTGPEFHFSIDWNPADLPIGGNLPGVSFEHYLDNVTRILGWYVRSDLKIGLLRGSTEIDTSTLTLTQGFMSVIVTDATIADSGGNVKITVDGVEFINFTGDTHGGSAPLMIDHIIIGHLQPFGSNTTHYFDNAVLLDASPFEFEIEPPGTSLGPISGEICHSVLSLGIAGVVTPVGYLRAQFILNGTGGAGFGDYNGDDCKFYIEMVGSNSGSVSKTAKVYGDGGLTLVCAYPIDPDAGGITLGPRIEFLPTGTDSYIIEPPEQNDGDIIVYEIRVIIDQVNGTRRKVSFPFGCSPEGLAVASDATLFVGELDRTGNHAVPGANDEWYPCSGVTLWHYDAADWDHISYLTFNVLGAAAFATAYFVIYDQTIWRTLGLGINDPMPFSCLIESSRLWYGRPDLLATPLMLRRDVSISAKKDDGFDTPEFISGHDYGIAFSSGHGGRNAMIYNGWLDIIQDVANKSQTYFRFMKGSAGAGAGGTVVTSRFRINKDEFSNYRGGLIETDAENGNYPIDVGTVNLDDVGSQDTGIVGATVVGTVSITFERFVRRSSAINPTGASGTRYIGQILNSTTGVVTYGSFFIVRQTVLIAFGALECGITEFDLSTNVGF